MCVTAMVKIGCAPPRFLVTALTFFIQAAFVNIILGMTRNAFCRRLFAVERFGVARVALGRCVFSYQGKARLFGMTKLGFPIVGVMASLTFFTISPFVCIVLAMACDTSTRRIFVAVVHMTRIAFRVRMLAAQRKARFLMIKFGVLPRLVVMAAFAFFAQTTLVLIVFAVAGNAR